MEAEKHITVMLLRAKAKRTHIFTVDDGLQALIIDSDWPKRSVTERLGIGLPGGLSQLFEPFSSEVGVSAQQEVLAVI